MRGYLLIPLLFCGLVLAPAKAHPPYGLVADRDENLYFSDLERVWRLSRDGRLSVFRPYVPDTHVHALALTPDGAIEGDQNHYDPAAKRFYSGLWRRTVGGKERVIVSMMERPPPGIGLWQDALGNRYNSQWLSTADRRVVLRQRSASGEVEVLFNESGGAALPPQSSVESVGGMVTTADGSLFFANGGVLRRVDSEGKVTKVYDGGTGVSLRGLAAAPDGRVVAADASARAVLAIGADGTASTLYRETAPWVPTAVAVSGSQLLVLEANADPYERDDRVRVIEVKNGHGRVVASPANTQVAIDAAPPLEGKTGSRSSLPILIASLATLLVVVGVRWSWSLRDRSA